MTCLASSAPIFRYTSEVLLPAGFHLEAEGGGGGDGNPSTVDETLRGYPCMLRVHDNNIMGKCSD